MGQLIDISKRLTNEKSRIKIDNEHIYEVCDSKNTVILIKEIYDDKKIKDFDRDGDKVDKVIEAALGTEALTYLKSLDLSVNGWNLIIEAIMAAINEMPLEEAEKEAKKAQAKQVKEFRK